MKTLRGIVVALALLSGVRADDRPDTARTAGEPILDEWPEQLVLVMLDGGEILVSGGRRLKGHEELERYLREQFKRLERSMTSRRHAIILRGLNDMPFRDFMAVMRLCRDVFRDSSRFKLIVESAARK